MPLVGQPRISIVTVTFNAGKVVEKTIHSVAKQTYDNLEYLLIDGASKDDTLDIAGRYHDCIDILVSEPDKGIYDAMNKGIAVASGDFVLMLNADDELADKDVISDVAAFITNHPEADAVCGNALAVYEYGTYPYLSHPEALEYRMSVSHQATFVRRELLREHPFDTHFRYAADYEQLSSLKLEGHIFLHIDRTIARLEMRGGTTHDNMLASAEEHYSILAARGMKIETEKRKMMRHKKMVRAFKNYLPGFLVNPALRVIAKYFKPL